MRISFFSALYSALFLLLTLWPDSAMAHRINIFAWVEGNDIIAECGFSRSQKLGNGLIEVQDAVNGTCLLKGCTDKNGIFRFAIPAEARNSNHDLRLIVHAGEGHRNEWIVRASEWAGSPLPSVSPVHEQPVSNSISATTTAASLTAADVERIINTALDTRLAPIKKAIAAQNAAGPTLQDVVGGLGWILGLLGIAVWFQSRMHRSSPVIHKSVQTSAHTKPEKDAHASTADASSSVPSSSCTP